MSSQDSGNDGKTRPSRRTDEGTERVGRVPPPDPSEVEPVGDDHGLPKHETEGWDTIVLSASEFATEKSTIEANVILIAHPENKLLGTRYRLEPGGTLTIGRAPEAEMAFPDIRSISRLHARLTHGGEMVTIEDLGSKNCTYVNDRRIESPIILISGDRFQVGSLHFKFLHELDVEHAYHDAIYDLGMRDGLTGIYNKRKFVEEIEREFLRASRYKRPTTLVLFDLDEFKKINDQNGHLCGDFVLKRLTAIVRAQLEEQAVFGRIGGDEFGILLPETATRDGLRIAELLRDRIATAGFDYGDHKIPVACSFGVAEFEPGMSDFQDLYEACDRALYRSKAAGRNRVSL